MSAASAEAISAGLPGETSRPLTPSSTASGTPPTREATTGQARPHGFQHAPRKTLRARRSTKICGLARTGAGSADSPGSGPDRDSQGRRQRAHSAPAVRRRPGPVPSRARSIARARSSVWWSFGRFKPRHRDDAHRVRRGFGAQFRRNVVNAVVDHVQPLGFGDPLAQGQILLVLADANDRRRPARMRLFRPGWNGKAARGENRPRRPAVRRVDGRQAEPRGTRHGRSSRPWPCAGKPVRAELPQLPRPVRPTARRSRTGWMERRRYRSDENGTPPTASCSVTGPSPPTNTMTASCPRSSIARARSRTCTLAPPTASARVIRRRFSPVSFCETITRKASLRKRALATAGATRAGPAAARAAPGRSPAGGSGCSRARAARSGSSGRRRAKISLRSGSGCRRRSRRSLSAPTGGTSGLLLPGAQAQPNAGPRCSRNRSREPSGNQCANGMPMWPSRKTSREGKMLSTVRRASARGGSPAAPASRSSTCSSTWLFTTRSKEASSNGNRPSRISRITVPSSPLRSASARVAPP